MMFKLLQGKHSENGLTYKAGDVFFSAVDLEDRFGSDRFHRCEDAPEDAGEFQKSSEASAPEEALVAAIRRQKPVGEDVTHLFEVDEIFQIFKKGRHYDVVAGGEEVATGLWKKDVLDACEEYLEE